MCRGALQAVSDDETLNERTSSPDAHGSIVGDGSHSQEILSHRGTYNSSWLFPLIDLCVDALPKGAPQSLPSPLLV